MYQDGIIAAGLYQFENEARNLDCKVDLAKSYGGCGGCCFGGEGLPKLSDVHWASHAKSKFLT